MRVRHATCPLFFRLSFEGLSHLGAEGLSAFSGKADINRRQRRCLEMDPEPTSNLAGLTY
jgi:hypothetical protein